MFLQECAVSRKTPRDGKLEISAPTAERLRARPALRVRVSGDDADARVAELSCTCRGPDERHVHHFLESDLLRALPPERHVALSLDETADVILVADA